MDRFEKEVLQEDCSIAKIKYGISDTVRHEKLMGELDSLKKQRKELTKEIDNKIEYKLRQIRENAKKPIGKVFLKLGINKVGIASDFVTDKYGFTHIVLDEIVTLQSGVKLDDRILVRHNKKKFYSIDKDVYQKLREEILGKYKRIEEKKKKNEEGKKDTERIISCQWRIWSSDICSSLYDVKDMDDAIKQHLTRFGINEDEIDVIEKSPYHCYFTYNKNMFEVTRFVVWGE